MAKPNFLFTLSLSLVVLFNGSLASRQYQQQGQCQFDRIDALEPDNRIECEAGVIESWNPNDDQFQCAGVAVVRRSIEPRGLLLPSYSNAPQLIYVVRGGGVTGVMLAGCPETFQESQQTGGSSRFQDQHQRVRRFRQGDVIAIPAGVSHWCYNDGNEPVVTVSVLDVKNKANQLDLNPRHFYLAGNPEDEFQQQYDERRDPRGAREYMGPEQGDCNNLFCGLDSRPPRTQQERQEQLERERGRSPGRGSHYNGLEETFCTTRIIENIGDPSRADVFVPEAGRVSTVNSHKLPILQRLQLSASHVVLRNNAVRLPHWHLNAHSVIYAVRGQALVQVIDENGNAVFNGNVREGQVLTVPQNFAVVKRTERDVFEYVAFKTNDNAMTNDLAGPTSGVRALPVEVIANAYRVSLEDARRLKYGTQETTLTSARPRSGRWAEA
ncbi:hypothetical protein GH714_030528 [Hevea brasiliensis]|uniref:Cupin type-1 domain-containing protein n=1 Tax=Hevea brasiliensis TaxID=3981 RepID=A0A6A6KD91_HEVBR|nr:hypothetical protein GH714_030528 [Hevea brasiliensis]